MHRVCDHNSDYYFYNHVCPPGSPLVPNGTPWWHWVVLAALIAFGLMVLASIVRIVQQSEKGVVFRLGKYVRTVEPGLRLKWPFIEEMYKVSMQIETTELEPQQVITKDSVSLAIHAVVYYKVTVAEDSIIKIDDVDDAISRLAPAIMRRVIGQHSLEDILGHNDNVDEAIKSELEEATNDWGVRIDRIELQDIQLPESMSRAMAAKAEATREAEAKIIAAKGENDAAQQLREAADKLDDKSMELRRLQTWREIGTDNATIIVVARDGEGNAAASAAAGALAATQE